MTSKEFLALTKMIQKLLGVEDAANHQQIAKSHTSGFQHMTSIFDVLEKKATLLAPVPKVELSHPSGIPEVNENIRLLTDWSGKVHI